jgi:hypothetical protein
MIKEEIVLTDAQTKWLRKHFKHTKNDVIRERLGLSHSTLHRIARELGLKKTRQFMAKMQMAASMAGKAAIAAEDEAAKERRRQQANANRNPERCFKKGKWSLAKCPPEKLSIINAKRAASWLKTRRADEVRLNWGLPTQTKFHFRRHLDPDKNRKLCSLRNYLKRKGYEIPGRAGMAAYVTRETRRSAKMETKAKKLGMIIKLAA